MAPSSLATNPHEQWCPHWLSALITPAKLWEQPSKAPEDSAIWPPLNCLCWFLFLSKTASCHRISVETSASLGERTYKAKPQEQEGQWNTNTMTMLFLRLWALSLLKRKGPLVPLSSQYYRRELHVTLFPLPLIPPLKPFTFTLTYRAVPIHLFWQNRWRT